MALAGLAALAFGGPGCGLDSPLFGLATNDDLEEVPGAGSNFIAGKSTALPAGSEVAFITASGTQLSDIAASTGADGGFLVTLPATTALVNTLVAVKSGAREVWGVLPAVERKLTVYEPDRTYTLGDTIPAMSDLGLDSTFATLVLLGQSRYGSPPLPFSALAADASTDAANEVMNLLEAADERVLPLHQMLERLLAEGATTAPPLRAFPAADESFLDVAALGTGLDYDGDGTADTTTEAFDAALAAAVGAQQFDTCFPDDRIRVVMMVDFNPGGIDRNCAPIDRFKWTKDEPGRRMFIVGALHPDTPSCESDPPPCLDKATFDAASEKLGKWTPNTAQMYDDGTNGDAVAGDNVWTLALELPWFDAGDPTARWVRMHYKYTYGNPGQLWTSTEEWPGNSRLLELRDTNGDRIITRYDVYGDETTNKDNANLLAPSKGGCGKVVWQSDGPKEGCNADTLENMIDIDADCVLDTMPSPGSASPITIPCEDDGE
jgi:hypothetical protein